MAALAGPAPVPGPPPRAPAVLVLVRQLEWENAPPAIRGWARASLSLRSARARAAAADGYLTLSKGAPAATSVLGAGVGPVETTSGGGVGLADWDRLLAHDASLRYAGRLGTLGRALATSPRSWTLVYDDPAAAAAVADRQGVVARALPGGAGEVGRALAGGADVVVVAVASPGLAAVVSAARHACVLVASVSTPEWNSHLGVLAASPRCGLGDGGLASPTTHQTHLATIFDVAPTFLSLAGVARPAGIRGSVVRPSGSVPVSSLVERDRRAYVADDVRPTIAWWFVGMTAAGAALSVLWRRARPVTAWTLLAVPPASFLVMVVPWWRWGFTGLVAAGGAIAGCLALGAAVLGYRHGQPVGVGFLAATTAAVIGIDALFGGRLEIDAPFGNSPVVGGRFYGVGNIGSGLLMGGLVVVTALALDRWGRRALPACAGVLGAGAIAGGAPWFGADVGGVLAAVPAYGTLLAVTDRRRPPLRLLLALAAMTVAVLSLFIAADLARPSAERSHLGRAVAGSDLRGEVLRKGDRALGTVRSPLSLVALVGVAAVVACRPRLGGRRALTAMAWALGVAAAVGSLVNDSGLVVASAVVAVGWPALVVAGAGTDAGGGRLR